MSEDRQQQQQQRQPAAAVSQTETQTQEPDATVGAPTILRLRGAHSAGRRTVQWAEDVVDNEGLGRKSSKVCCIYHKPKAVDESSDDSSSDSSSSSHSSDSDSDPDSETESKPQGSDKQRGNGCRHARSGGRRERRGGQRDKKKRPPSPNAYEKVPKPKSDNERDKTKNS